MCERVKPEMRRLRYAGQLVSNILSTAEQLAIVFGTEADDLKIYQTIEQRKENPIQPRVVVGV